LAEFILAEQGQAILRERGFLPANLVS